MWLRDLGIEKPAKIKINKNANVKIHAHDMSTSIYDNYDPQKDDVRPYSKGKIKSYPLESITLMKERISQKLDSGITRGWQIYEFMLDDEIQEGIHIIPRNKIGNPMSRWTVYHYIGIVKKNFKSETATEKILRLHQNGLDLREIFKQVPCSLDYFRKLTLRLGLRKRGEDYAP